MSGEAADTVAGPVLGAGANTVAAGLFGVCTANAGGV